MGIMTKNLYQGILQSYIGFTVYDGIFFSKFDWAFTTFYSIFQDTFFF